MGRWTRDDGEVTDGVEISVNPKQFWLDLLQEDIEAEKNRQDRRILTTKRKRTQLYLNADSPQKDHQEEEEEFI